MKFLKDYKGVALIYLVITIINIICLVNYEKPNENIRVQNEKAVAMVKNNNY